MIEIRPGRFIKRSFKFMSFSRTIADSGNNQRFSRSFSESRKQRESKCTHKYVGRTPGGHIARLYRLELLAKYADQAFFCVVLFMGVAASRFTPLESAAFGLLNQLQTLLAILMHLKATDTAHNIAAAVAQSNSKSFSRNVNYHIFSVECDH